MNFTFGIITFENYNDHRIQKCIDSIIVQNIPKYEIIIVGNTSIPNTERVSAIPFDEHQKPNWITRKKNICCEKAKYDNIVLMHDYVKLSDHWYKGFCKYGNDFDVCITPIKTIKGDRYRDFTIYPPWTIPYFQERALLPFDYDVGATNPSINKFLYYSGTYYILKKHIASRYPLDESLVWCQQEDLEWCSRLSNANIIFKCNPYSEVHLTKDKASESWEREMTDDDVKLLNTSGVLESSGSRLRLLKRTLVISPQAGFANRMRTMASCAIMADFFGYEYEHCWDGKEPSHPLEPAHVSEAKKRNFNTLCVRPIPVTAEDIEFDLIITEWDPVLHYWGLCQNSPSFKYKSLVVADHKTPWEILASFSPKDKPRTVLVRASRSCDNPNQSEMINRVNRGSFYQRHLTPLTIKLEKTIGLHIRTGDLLHYFPESAISIEKVETTIEQIKNNGFSALVVTNDSVLKDASLNASGVLKHKYPCSSTFIDDWMSLATTRAVLGTPHSAFAMEACLFSGSPYSDDWSSVGIMELIHRVS